MTIILRQFICFTKGDKLQEFPLSVVYKIVSVDLVTRLHLVSDKLNLTQKQALWKGVSL